MYLLGFQRRCDRTLLSGSDGDIDHAYWNAPELDEMDRPAFFLTGDKPQTDYVASAAASLAINYLNFKDTDPEYAQKSLDYATALYKFAETHEKQLSDNGDGPKSYYNSSKWEDDYCWASAWMYKITGDHHYSGTDFPVLRLLCCTLLCLLLERCLGRRAVYSG